MLRSPLITSAGILTCAQSGTPSICSNWACEMGCPHQGQRSGAAVPEADWRRPPAPTFQEWAIYRLTQLGVLVGLCLVLYFVLYNFWNLKHPNALGFSIILSLIASFFLRSLATTS